MAENNSSAPLLPCPFCGASAAVQNESPADNSGGYFVECKSCGASTNLRYACGDDPVPMLVAQWNTRAPQAVAALAPAAVADGDTTTREQYRRMFEAACVDLGRLNEALGLDPDDGGADPILEAIEELRATPELPATEHSSAGDLAHDALRCAVGNCTFNGEVAQHAAGCQQPMQSAQAEVQAEPVAWANWKVGSTFYAPYRTRTQAQASVSQSEIFETQEGPFEVVPLYTAPQAQPADALDAEIAKLKKTCQELGNMFHDQIVAQQAAWIEWQHGAGAEAGMQWIENGLCGPGHIPDEDEPYGTEPQAYFDANKSDPFPACYCGRPSNILWMGKGFCSDAHHDEHRAAMAAAQEGGKS